MAASQNLAAKEEFGSSPELAEIRSCAVAVAGLQPVEIPHAVGLGALVLLHCPDVKTVRPGIFISILSELGLEALDYPVLEIPTCQRFVVILFSSLPETFLKLARRVQPGIELFRGREAYRFLLSLSCGLESRLLGETEIFGQIKKAWGKFSSSLPVHPHAHVFQNLMQRLFEDTKEIRCLHLNSFGSQSYGRILRQWIQLSSQHVQREVQQVLLIGSGQLAESIFPYLRGLDVSLANRTPEAEQRVRAWGKKEGFRGEFWLLSELMQANRRWDLIIFATPWDEKLLESIAHLGSWIVHFGVDHSDRFVHLIGLEYFYEKCQADVKLREGKITQARHMIHQKAHLRMVGPSASWEDLAFFLE